MTLHSTVPPLTRMEQGVPAPRAGSPIATTGRPHSRATAFRRRGIRLRSLPPPESCPPFSAIPCLRRSDSAPVCEAVRACFRFDGSACRCAGNSGAGLRSTGSVRPCRSSALPSTHSTSPRGLFDDPAGFSSRRAATCRAPTAPDRRGHPVPGPDDLLLHGHHREAHEERSGRPPGRGAVRAAVGGGPDERPRAPGAASRQRRGGRSGPSWRGPGRPLRWRPPRGGAAARLWDQGLPRARTDGPVVRFVTGRPPRHPVGGLLPQQGLQGRPAGQAVEPNDLSAAHVHEG